MIPTDHPPHRSHEHFARHTLRCCYKQHRRRIPPSTNDDVQHQSYSRDFGLAQPQTFRAKKKFEEGTLRFNLHKKATVRTHCILSLCAPSEL